MEIEIAYTIASVLGLSATLITYLKINKRDSKMFNLVSNNPIDTPNNNMVKVDNPIDTPVKQYKNQLTTADKIFILLQKHSFDGALQNIHTPRPLVNEILNKVSINPTDNILVLFNLEFVVSLVYDYNIPTANITFYSDHDEKTEFAKQIQVNTITDLTEQSMALKLIVGNPPYQGTQALHQQFFNKSVDLLSDNGTVAFIQPATPYFNKKAKKKKPEQKMIDNINQYHTTVKFVRGNVFDNAAIATDLAITYLTKIPSSNGVNYIEYQNGSIYDNVDIADISLTQMNPEQYKSIRHKFLAYIETNGCLQDKISTDKNTFKASITGIRGNHGKADFFTFIPTISNRTGKCADNYTDFGIIANDQQEVNNIFHYLESYVARMGLALLKFNTHNNRDELKTVPLVDFKKTFTDQELFDMIGLNQQEINTIKSVISNYYNR